MSLAPVSSRFRIAFVVDRFGNRYGGAESYGVELMRELAGRHDITVFAREYDPECGLDLPFIALKSPRGLPSWVRVLWFAIRVRRLTRDQFDIVHSHVNGYCGDVEVVHVIPVRYNWRVRQLSPIKYFLSFFSPRVQAYLRLERARLRGRPGHRVVAVSELIAERLRMAYGKQRQFPVVPPGVASCVPDAGLRLSTRADLGYSVEDQVCLLVARNPLRKGLPTVLKALAQLAPHYKLLVVGADAAAKEFLRAYPDKESLAGRVVMIDETSDVAPYYRAADVYVHPTLNDSFGMAPLEAMSYGLPVILSPSPWCGFAQYVQPSVEALILPHPEAHEELAAGIARIAADPRLAETLKSGGAAVVERHSWAKVARQYELMYAQCLAEKAGALASVPDDLQIQ